MQLGSRQNTELADNGSGGWFSTLWRQYDRFLNWDYRIPLSTLALYRIAFALYLLIQNSIPDLRWIAAYPDEFYNPAPGLSMVWGGFPPMVVMAVMEISVILAACALAVGWRTKATSIAVTVLGVLANSAYFTFGKIDHTFVLWMVPAVLAWSGWGAFYSRDRLVADRGTIPAGSGIKPEHLDYSHLGPNHADLSNNGGRQGSNRRPQIPRSPGWPAATMGIFLAIAFLTAALPKLLRGWLSPSSTAAYNHFALRYYGLDRQGLLADVAASVDAPILWELADWATVGLELALAFVVLWKRPYRCLLFITWTFHVANVVFMNIGFYSPTFVYPIFFLGLVNPTTAEAIGRWLVSRRFVVVPLLIPIALLAYFDSGLWWMAGRLLGIDQLTVDLTYFAAGVIPLVFLALKSRGFSRLGLGDF